MAKFKIVQQNGKQSLRSADYRKRYFEKHNGYFGIHCCSYCGKLLSEEKSTVDHIIPVHAAEQSRFLRWLFHWDKEGINTLLNLTVACERCNTKKGSRCGIWLLRGWIGRFFFPMFWIVFLVSWPTFLSYAIAFFYIVAEQF